MSARPNPSARASLAFGVVLPIACLALDPIVFRSSGVLVGRLGAPMFGELKVAGFSAVALGIASLVVWLTARRPPELLCGLLAGAAAFAFALGLILLPFSLAGLMAGVGALGLVPFGTAWVYAGQARAASAAAGRTAGAWAVAGLLAAGGGPLGVQAGARAAVRAATERIADGRPTPLARAAIVIDSDAVVWCYVRETDPDRRRRLADAYARATGTDIDERRAVLLD